MATDQSKKKDAEPPHSVDATESSTNKVEVYKPKKSVSHKATQTTLLPYMSPGVTSSPDGEVPIRLPQTNLQLNNRRRVYLEDLYAIQTYPETVFMYGYYRLYPQKHKRIIPWLYRELKAIFQNYNSVFMISYLYIGYVIMREALRGKELRRKMRPYLGKLTRHFQHELVCFCGSELTKKEYDRVVSYCSIPVDRSGFGNAGNLDAVDVRLNLDARRLHNPEESEENCVDYDSDDTLNEIK